MTAAPPPFLLHEGTEPLLVSIPHVGTWLPPELAVRMTGEARRVPDTDWHLDRLYDFARELGASVLQATHSRYVIDLNRPRDGSSLYPGRSVTALCPVDTFDDTPVYLDGQAPDADEIASRVERHWQPYHAALAGELTRLRARHGIAMLWEAHSIRSVLPRFFDGRLPDFNLGTVDGASCEPALAAGLLAIARAVPGHTAVLDGRFKGGYITREYGRPDDGVHAVQLELTQCAYMDETWPFAYAPDRAERVRPALRGMLETMLAYARRPVRRSTGRDGLA